MVSGALPEVNRRKRHRENITLQFWREVWRRRQALCTVFVTHSAGFKACPARPHPTQKIN